jgi:hypothetical protein
VEISELKKNFFEIKLNFSLDERGEDGRNRFGFAAFPSVTSIDGWKKLNLIEK